MNGLLYIFIIFVSSFCNGIMILGTNGIETVTENEIARIRYESEVLQNLELVEFGKFDFGEIVNGRYLRLNGIHVPRNVEVLLRILSSPILRNGPFNGMTTFHSSLLRHFSFFRSVIKLKKNGAAYQSIVDVLSNDIQRIRRTKAMVKPGRNWPTYLDNVAAYAFLWQHVKNIFSIKAIEPLEIYKGTPHYTDENGRVLRFKYRFCIDEQKCRNLASVLSHWAIDKLPLSDDFVNSIHDMVNNVDRSRYPIEFFSVVSTNGSVAYPNYVGDMKWSQVILADVERVAAATIKFVHLFLARLLEHHGIPVFKCLAHRTIYYRVYPSSRILSLIRLKINRIKQEAAIVTPIMFNGNFDDKVQIEELLYESASKFNPYWSLKNDSLYNRYSGESTPLSILFEAETSHLLFEPDFFLRNLLSGNRFDINYVETKQMMDVVLKETCPAHNFYPPSALLDHNNTCKQTWNNIEIVKLQYELLDEDHKKILVSKTRCLMALFYLFGIADKNGKATFPNGWPRDLNKTLKLTTQGLGSKCGLCNAIIGFLAAIGYPKVTRGMYAWEVIKGVGESVVYQMFLTSNSEKEEKAKSDEDPTIFNPNSPFDSILLSYLSGYYKQDVSSSLAYGYYIFSGMGKPNRMLDDSTPRNGIERTPQNVGSRCIEAIPYVIEAARSAMRSKLDYIPDDASEEYKSKKYAEFVKKLAVLGDSDGLRVMGDFHYVGHEAAGIHANQTEALYYWRMAAERGDAASALTVANHYLSNGNLSSDDLSNAERLLRMVSESGTSAYAASARFYLARYGLGEARDPVAAARWLRQAADYGDLNSQLLMGHAFVGIMPDVTPQEGKNIFLALEYYKRAAKSDIIIAKFNCAVLTLHGYDVNHTTALDRCKVSYKLFAQVGRSALVPSAVRIFGKRAKQSNDQIGHVLASMFLSEMGDAKSHVATTNYFILQKHSNKLCYVNSNLMAKTKMEPYSRGDVVNSCYYFYARRSGYDAEDSWPLLLAEALLSGNPWKPQEALEWAKKAQNNIKGKFLYGTMLEVGLGASQDCLGAYRVYTELTSSPDRKERLLGLLCIGRSALMSVLSGSPRLYRWIAQFLYDQHALTQIIREDYKSCRWIGARPMVVNRKSMMILSSIFAIILGFSAVVFVKVV